MNSIVLLSYVFASSFVASGAMPYISDRLTHLNSAWGFWPYFAFLFLGQLSVFLSTRIRHSAKRVLLSSFFAFNVTVLALGFVLKLDNDSQLILVLFFLRAIEGYFIGLSLPLVFEFITQSQITDSKEKNLVILNGVNIVGFVAGMPAGRIWPNESLIFFSISFGILNLIWIALTIIHFSKKWSPTQPDKNKSLTISEHFISGVYPTFLAKVFYG